MGETRDYQAHWWKEDGAYNCVILVPDGGWTTVQFRAYEWRTLLKVMRRFGVERGTTRELGETREKLRGLEEENKRLRQDRDSFDQVAGTLQRERNDARYKLRTAEEALVPVANTLDDCCEVGGCIHDDARTALSTRSSRNTPPQRPPGLEDACDHHVHGLLVGDHRNWP